MSDELLFVPENGSQLFELTNSDTKERAIDVDVFSTRLAVVEEKNGEKTYKRTFSTVLPPNQSAIFQVGDKGFHSKDPDNSCPFEGFVQITVTEEPNEKEGIPSYHYLPRISIEVLFDTDSGEKEPEKREKRNRTITRSSDSEAYPDENEEGNPLDKLIKIREVEGKKKLVKKEVKKQPKKGRGPFAKTSSTTPEDSTTSTSEILPKPEKHVIKVPKNKSVVTTLDEVTPPSKSLKLADVVFSDRPPKPSPSGETDKKSKITSSIEKDPPKIESKVKPKTRKLNDVVFVDKPKGPSQENVLKVKTSKSPMKSQEKKDRRKKMKKNKEKCLIS